MEHWYRQNKTLIPWTLLGLELAISVGLRLYKIRTGIEQDTQVALSPLQTLLSKPSSLNFQKLNLPTFRILQMLIQAPGTWHHRMVA